MMGRPPVRLHYAGEISLPASGGARARVIEAGFVACMSRPKGRQVRDAGGRTTANVGAVTCGACLNLMVRGGVVEP